MTGSAGGPAVARTSVSIEYRDRDYRDRDYRDYRRDWRDRRYWNNRRDWRDNDRRYYDRQAAGPNIAGTAIATSATRSVIAADD